MKSTTLSPAAPAAGDPIHPPGARARRQRPARFVAVAATAAFVLALAACGSGGSSSPSSGGKLTVADVAPFSGADAALGPTYWPPATAPPAPSTPTVACSGTS